jgi:hypothetical protein
MIRSKYQLVRQLIDLLLEFPNIVQAFQTKSAGSIPLLSAWTQRSEDLLSTHRLPEAAHLAGVKSRMIAASAQDDRSSNSRKRQIQSAVACLEDFQQCLQDALRPNAIKIEQARDVLRNLLQIVASSGAIRYDPKHGLDGLIVQIWNLCNQHDQLKPHVVQLKSWLSFDDIRLLMAEEIEPSDFGYGAVALAKKKHAKNRS